MERISRTSLDRASGRTSLDRVPGPIHSRSGQTSSLFLGFALAVLLNQSALLCQTGHLSGFGWAILTSLAGCSFVIVSQWTRLIQAHVPEPETWRKALFAGVLLAGALLALGQAVSTQELWTPLSAIALVFIPWSRSLWRCLFADETIQRGVEQINSLLLFVAAVLFLFPELRFIQDIVRPGVGKVGLDFRVLYPLEHMPRSMTFISCLLFGAASALQNPQQRKISSLTYWAIPSSVAAFLLCATGWLSLNLTNTHRFVLTPTNNPPVHKLFILSPAILFGIVLIALRPPLQIRNVLKLGRDKTRWWQLLGLSLGTLVSFFIFKSMRISILEVLTFITVLVGQFVSLSFDATRIRFAPTLSSVRPPKTLDDPLLNSRQH